MPRMRPATRNLLSSLLNARQQFSGSLILPHSLPADRLMVNQLSAITANLGRVTSGTIISGDPAGAHTIMGREARNGLQMYERPNRMVASMSPENGGSFRLGALNRAGITMVGGNVQIDGDCIVEGSLRTNRLIVGSLARVVLDDDEIRVGTYDVDGKFSGFLAQTDVVGGWNRDAQTWYVDPYTGHIISAGSHGWPYSGVQIGSGVITLSKFRTFYKDADPTIYFRSYWMSDEGDFTLGGEIGLMADELGLTVKPLQHDYGAHFTAKVTDTSAPWGMLKNDRVRIETPGGDTVELRIDEYAHWLESSQALRIAAGASGKGIVMDDLQVYVYGAPLALFMGTGASGFTEGSVEWDSTNHKVRVWDGTQWRNLAYES